MPYGPRRPTACQVVVWVMVAAIGLLPVALFVVVFLIYLLSPRGMDDAIPF